MSVDLFNHNLLAFWFSPSFSSCAWDAINLCYFWVISALNLRYTVFVTLSVILFFCYFLLLFLFTCPCFKWESKTQVTSLDIWVGNSDLRVTSSFLRVTSSDPRVKTSDLWVASWNPQIRRLKHKLKDFQNHKLGK